MFIHYQHLATFGATTQQELSLVELCAVFVLSEVAAVAVRRSCLVSGGAQHSNGGAVLAYFFQKIFSKNLFIIKICMFNSYFP